jgi:glyoxylase-like metal-dependent hydrolase (beta-lactamase superfamily II)
MDSDSPPTEGVAGTARDEAGQLKETSADAARQVAGTVKDKASDVTSDVREQTRWLAHQTRDELAGQASILTTTSFAIRTSPVKRGKWILQSILGVEPPPLTEVHQFLREGDTLRWGNLQAQVIHTPGHTPGSSCLYLPPDAGKITIAAPQLFAGDTLFAGSIGRTDLWGGSMEKIMDSLVHKLLALPDETVVYPGHGQLTTIGEERQSNPFLR